MKTTPFDTIFSICRRTLGSQAWGGVLAAMGEEYAIESFPDFIKHLTKKMSLPEFLPDLAHLELMVYQTESAPFSQADPTKTVAINPTVGLFATRWRHLDALFLSKDQPPECCEEPVHIMIWRHPKSDELMIRQADAVDLLALKIVVEGVDFRSAAIIGDVTPKKIQIAIDQAIEGGILLPAASQIRRMPRPVSPPEQEPFLSADIFTLQWHVTQKCDLSCKHCYDRSDRSPMPLGMAMSILDDFFDFCQRLHVSGQVTFTGGNPLLYPHFKTIYQAASDLGFGLAILGNPTSIEKIENLLKTGKPHYIQISLEGLADHNDYIRGSGHFSRSMKFLNDLRELGVTTTVMLTLTKKNLQQVIPLAEHLKNRTDSFTFNRLSTVGDGAKLLMPETFEFESFLREYVDAAKKNPIMGLKDNLINIIRMEKGEKLFGGCTGYGCGAAFNFMALLPDGEVHACRKFPSLIGNFHDNSLYDIYQSDLAQRYRAGSSACRKCHLNAVCRGCLAVVQSMGLDPFWDRDPFCFAPLAITQGA